MTKAYLAYLNQHIEIAPANSQEEVDAAAAIESVLRSQSGLSVEKHDIAGPAEISFVCGILGTLFFLGVLLSGIGGIFWAIFGLLFAALGFTLLLLRFLDRDVLAHILPVGRSQNLVAHHKGYGPHSGHGTRPIVVVAHYDTGKEELLYKPSIARYSSKLFTIAPYGAAAAAICCLFQPMVFLPEPFLRVVWVLGMLAAFPALIWGVNNIAAKFMPLSGAANDNNASVAALLGVVEDVCVSDPAKRAERRASLLEVAAKEAEEARELGLEGFTDVSNTILPKEEEPHPENPAMHAADPAITAASQALETTVDAGAPAANPESNDMSSVTTSTNAVTTSEGAPTTSNTTTRNATTTGNAAMEAATDDTSQLAEDSAGVSTENAVAKSELHVSGERTVETFANDGATTDIKTEPSHDIASVQTVPTESIPDEMIQTEKAVEETVIVETEQAVAPKPTPEPNLDFTAVRHGAEVIGSLGILPGYCDLEYVEELVSDPTQSHDESLQINDGFEPFEHTGDNQAKKNDADTFGMASKHTAAARRARRRIEIAPTSTLEKVKAFFAGLPNPVDLLGGERSKKRDSENARQRRRPQDALVQNGYEGEIAAPSNYEEHTSSAKERGALSNQEAVASLVSAEPLSPDQATSISSGDPAEVGKSHQEAVLSFDQTSLSHTDNEVADKEITANIAVTRNETPTTGSGSIDVPAPQTEESATKLASDAQEEIGDPLWGTSSFEPLDENKNVARRAALFDLPDPSVATVDPLSDDFQIQHTGEIDPRDFPVEEFGVPHTAHTPRATSQEMEEVEVLHEDAIHLPTEADKPGPWKGGATFTEPERANGNTEDAPEKQIELEEAVLDMDYVDLVSHDIWFVLTGGSGLDHAGAKTFFKEHKKDLRGACVINLEAVGAGELTALTEEGFGFNKKADRRILRFIKDIARDVHVPVLREKRVWADTEATFAMREHMRSVTLMGTDAGQVPALAHTDQNVPENVDPNQVAQANMLVSELIRRL